MVDKDGPLELTDEHRNLMDDLKLEHDNVNIKIYFFSLFLIQKI